MPSRAPLLTAAVAAAIALLLAPIPLGDRVSMALLSLFHAPLFAVLAALLTRRLVMPAGEGAALKGLYLWAALAALGAATELAQPLVGRNGSWQDVWANSLGAAAGVLWVLAGASARRGALRLGAAGLLAVGEAVPLAVAFDVADQWRAMPQIASFEQPLELQRWSTNHAEMQRTREHATDGSWALRVDLQPRRHSGVSMDRPRPDWSGYGWLEADIHVEGEGPLPVTIRVCDMQFWDRREPSDRFERTVVLGPGRNTLRIAMTDVARGPAERTLDVDRISFLQILAIDLELPRTIYVDHVRLEGKMSEQGD